MFKKAWLIAWAAPSHASQPPASSAKPLVSVSSFPLFLSGAAGRDPQACLSLWHHQKQFRWGYHVSYQSCRHSKQNPSAQQSALLTWFLHLFLCTEQSCKAKHFCLVREQKHLAHKTKKRLTRIH